MWCACLGTWAPLAFPVCRRTLQLSSIGGKSWTLTAQRRESHPPTFGLPFPAAEVPLRSAAERRGWFSCPSANPNLGSGSLDIWHSAWSCVLFSQAPVCQRTVPVTRMTKNSEISPVRQHINSCRANGKIESAVLNIYRAGKWYGEEKNNHTIASWWNAQSVSIYSSFLSRRRGLVTVCSNTLSA